jgi:hypothetical protein
MTLRNPTSATIATIVIMGDLLYRVVDERSLIQFDPEFGFVAADTWSPFDPNNDPDSARDIIELHADWSNRAWTPLISMTDSEDHAWRLACSREEHGRMEVQIAIIDRELLESQVDVYRMLDLADAIGAEIAPKARSWREHICVHHLPIDAIIRVFTLSEFERYIMAGDEQEDNPWSYAEGGWEQEEGSVNSLGSEEEREYPFWDEEEQSEAPSMEEQEWHNDYWGDEESQSSLWSEEDGSQSASEYDDELSEW